MESKSSAKSGGIGCLGVIGIVLIVLKLLAVEPVAHWPWLWVLCPFWGPVAIVVILCILAAFFISHR